MRLDDMLNDESNDLDPDAAETQVVRPANSPTTSVTGPASGAHAKVVDAVSIGSSSTAQPPVSGHTPLFEQLASPARLLRSGAWADLPIPNRVFALSGAFCLALAALRAVVPAAAEATSSALHPYTVAGRSETCLANLASLQRALGMYTTDNDGMFPPLDYTRPMPRTKDGERVTWVSLVRDKTETRALQCPAGPGIGASRYVSSYALNPVLSLAASNNVDSAPETLLLADAGAKHDVSLLPPYPSWPSFAARGASTNEAQETLSNLDPRHEGHAAALYTDGHAGLITPGDLETAAATWGGSAVFRRSLARLSGQNTLVTKLVTHLKADEVGAAATLLRYHGKELASAKDGLTSLWVLNDGASASESVAEVGWNLARAATAIGDATVAKRLNEEESRRSQAELKKTEEGGWETKSTSWGASLQIPVSWTLEENIEGRYKRAYVRSVLAKELYVLHETGEHRSYVTPRPIDWHGMEKDLRKKYRGDRYKRIAMKRGTLNGQVANVWEFELDKLSGPRLRKRFVGYSDGWNSHVVTWVAPARDFGVWRSAFNKF